MREIIDYETYLKQTGQTDSRTSWKWWKVEVFGISEKEAIKASLKYYEPLEELR